MSRVAKPTPDELKRLVTVANRVWQYIGHDFMGEGGGDFDNEAAVECCFDADRPLFCNNGPEGQAEEDQKFCKAMYAKYGFNVCVASVASVAAEVRYV